MKKTLYISDLDGTLLNSRAEVSEKSKAIISRLITEKNILFSVATARTPATVVRMLDGIENRLPYIVMTGAAMWNNGLVNRRYIRPEEVDYLLEACRKAGVRPFVYSFDGSGLVAYHSPEMNDYEREFVVQRQKSVYKRFVFVDELPEEARQSTMLLFVSGCPEVLGVAYRQAQADGLPCTMSYYYDTYQPTVGFFEIMAEGASKAAALKSLVAETGAERVVVFGDSANDLSMREVADLFIAPANADEKVKAVADEVIGTNDDDSVARWIAADCGMEI